MFLLQTNIGEFSQAILAILPILCEILASDFCSNGKMLKFDKEITIGKMLKYMIMFM